MTSSSDAEFLAAFGGGPAAPASKTPAPAKPQQKKGLAGRIGESIFGAIPKPIRKAGLRVAAPIAIGADIVSRPLKVAAKGVVDATDYVSGAPANSNRRRSKQGYGDILTGKDTSFAHISGVDASKIKNPILRTGALAFNAAGEVATDPTSYFTVGVGSAASSGVRTAAIDAAETAGKAGVKHAAEAAAEAGVKKGAARAAFKAAKTLGIDSGEAAAYKEAKAGLKQA